MSTLLNLAEKGWMPEGLIRFGIRRLLEKRLAQCGQGTQNEREDRKNAFIELMKSGPIALVPEKANKQHYEVPPLFFQKVLGPNRKYSCCQYDFGSSILADAEVAALRLVCERARIEDGMTVLELGCGWGSLSLFIAENYPNCSITAVSNSNPQREFIESECERRDLKNLNIVTCDMNEFETEDRFSSIVSIEMFEHMRNWKELLRRVSTWLKPDGRCFIHVFCHCTYAYAFEDEGESDWMARYFFTGGIMPSVDLISQFQDDLKLAESWFINGMNYMRTSDAWLENMDKKRNEILPVLVNTYGEENALIWLQRWRMFFMSCSELFGYRNGSEWGVCHYVLVPRLEEN